MLLIPFLIFSIDPTTTTTTATVPTNIIGIFKLNQILILVRYRLKCSITKSSLIADGLNQKYLFTSGTCNDNIQNGDETGVDCGGRCNSCRK